MSSPTKVPDRFMIHVTLYFAPENVPIALEACLALFEAAWQQPELDFCQIVESADEPGVLRIQEAWNATRKHLDEVQLNKPYYEPYLKATEHLWLKPREIQIFERIREWTFTKPSFIKDEL